MSLLRSLFSFRDKSQGHAQGDVEKPFLDHLEDLRGTLMKMGSTLVFSMIIAFCFKNQLTRLLETPLDAVTQETAANGADPKKPHTERDRSLTEVSYLALSAAAHVAGKPLEPEERKILSDAVLAEYRASPTYKELDPALLAPLSTAGTAAQGKLQIIDVTESFTIALKLAFYAGIVLSFPFQLYFVINFVLPALTRKERRLLGPGILVGSLLFAVGVFIGFHWILPKTLVWFHHFGESMGFVANWKAGTYFSFVTQLCLACGFLCELPLVMVVLSVMNVISFSLLKSSRRYAVAIILVIVAIIAPTPDPITFFTLAIPMLAIFEGSIWLVWLIERNRRKKEMSGQTLGD